MTHKILIVDDERATRLALTEAFSQYDYTVDNAASGDEALKHLSESHFDVVILDLMMPGTKGVDVLQAADEIAPNTAFIVLTAYASADTAITALRSGAIDYLRKPSSLVDLLAAVQRAITKIEERNRQNEATQLLQQVLTTLQASSPSKPQQPVKVTQTTAVAPSAFIINQSAQIITYQGQQLDLTPIEYKLLTIFIKQANRVISYAELAQITHTIEVDEDEARSLLRTHIYRLRRKLGDVESSPLQIVRGRGLMLSN